MTVLIKTALLDEIGLKNVPIDDNTYDYITNLLIKKSDPSNVKQQDWMPHEKEYLAAITQNIKDQIEGSVAFMQSSDAMKALVEKNFDGIDEQINLLNSFNEALTPYMNDILFNKADTFKDFTDKFYQAGKEAGFKDMDVTSFMSAIDDHALYTVSNYDFGLIQNVSNDVQSAIKDAVGRGISEGKTILELAKDIKATGIDPIRSGYSGKLLTVDQRATLIARTESMRAVNQGTLVSYQQYGVSEVDIIGEDDDFTCDDCEEAQADSPYPIDNAPVVPMHPDCRDTYAAHDSASDTPSDVSIGNYVDLTQM